MRGILLELAGPFAAVALALVVGGVLIRLVTESGPIVAYSVLVQGAFGSVSASSETLVKAAPLLLTAVGIMVAFRAKVINLGAEGQLYMGAIATAGIGGFWSELPGPVYLPLTVGASMIAGAAWAAIPGILKARAKVNEVITSLMMNYVAIYLVDFLVNGPWRDPRGPEPMTPSIVAAARLGHVMPQSRLHIGIVFAVVSVVLAYVLLWRSGLGFRIRAVGAGPDASLQAGISVPKTIVLVMAISGGLAGLAGMGEIAGVHFRLMPGISGGYGFTAIVVALLGKLRPVGVAIASLLFAGLVVGADSMQQFAMVPAALVLVIQGLTILFVIGADAIANRLRIAA